MATTHNFICHLSGYYCCWVTYGVSWHEISANLIHAKSKKTQYKVNIRPVSNIKADKANISVLYNNTLYENVAFYCLKSLFI